MRRVSIMDQRGMRAAILEALEILAQPSAQLAYEASLVQAGHAPSELVAHYCNDLFHPRDLALSAEFTDDELKDLSHLYGLVAEAGRTQHPAVAAMLKDPAWRRVVEFAQEIRARFG